MGRDVEGAPSVCLGRSGMTGYLNARMGWDDPRIDPAHHAPGAKLRRDGSDRDNVAQARKNWVRRSESFGAAAFSASV